MTFYEQAGGEAVLRAVLQDLYDQLFDDLMVGFLFAGKDKAHIVEQQVRLTSRFLGGPHVYDGPAMPDAHRTLPLLPGHFDRRHHLLRLTLARHQVPAPVVEEWLKVDEAFRTSVLRSGDEARQRAREP